MALLVQKFGGTSLATLKHINHSADLIAKAKQAGHRVVVIVSAMSGETDKLIGLANEICEFPDEREYAALVATGEQVSMALMALALMQRGIKAKSYTGGQARILTCNRFKKARIQSIDIQPILNELAEGKVVVIAGFQGVDKDGNITTLGRGGSDTTAVAIAAALNADECQIYTDVDGVYTTDPKVVPDAKLLEQITFEEMLELSSLGAKVLQIRAVDFACKYQIPLRVLSSVEEGPGTLITYQQKKELEAPLVTGIAFSRNEAQCTLSGAPDAPGVASAILTKLSAIGVNVDMIVQHKTDFTFTVHSDEYQATMNQLGQLVNEGGASGVVGVSNLAKLSLVGTGLRSHPEVLNIMFKTLAEKGINIQLIATSEIKISVMIDVALLDEGVRALHKVFCLESDGCDESRVIPTPRLVEEYGVSAPLSKL
jgi:aspartate kinase